jgi:hypothetical protein
VRRRLVAITAILAAAALVVVGVILAGDDGNPSERAELPTEANGPTTTGPGPSGPDRAGDRQPPPTVTPPEGGPVGSSGSTPVVGALLDAPATFGAAEVGATGDCGSVAGAAETLGCAIAAGSGGRFLVWAGRSGEGAVQARLYRAGAGSRFEPVAESPSFADGVDVAGIAVAPASVGDEQVVVVDYDFDGSGAVHSYDVVAWSADARSPVVVAFVEGRGHDRTTQEQAALRFVSANYDDGAPTCCPAQADVRTLTRQADGSWRLDIRTVDWADAP